MANKTLTATAKLNTTQFEAKLKTLTDKINNLNKAVNRISMSNVEKQTNKSAVAVTKLNNQLSRTQQRALSVATPVINLDRLFGNVNQRISVINRVISKVRTNFQRLSVPIKKLNAAVQKVNTALSNAANTAANKLGNGLKKVGAHLKNLPNPFKGMLGTVGKIVAGLLSIKTIMLAMETSDSITKAENRLNAANGNDTTATAETMDKVYAASQRSRSSYTDMLSNVSKSMALAGDAFDNNIDNAIRFQEIMAKSYTLGGASDTEKETSMYQLVQALGSGTLAGDELRSVREGAPLAYQAIEKFANDTLGMRGSLKDLAADGLITSDIVVAAIMDMENGADNVNEKFKETKITFEDAGTMIKNVATQAFQPALQKMNDVLNSDAGKVMINEVANAFIVLGNIVMWLFDAIGVISTWIVDNWDWLRNIVIGVLIAIAGYIIYLTAVTIVNAAIQLVQWLMLNWQLVLIILTIVALASFIVWLANTTVSGCEFMVYAILAVAVAILLIGIITGSTVMVVVGIILLFVAFFLAIADKICGIVMFALAIIWDIIAGVVNGIVGLIAWLGATIWNIIAGCINGILQCIWAAAEPFIGIIEWILNACNGGFNSFGGAVANLIGQIISWFLSLGKVVTKIIDAIFGTDWTSGLNALQDKVLEWGKSDGAITLSRDAPELKRLDATNAFTAGSTILDYVNPLDAYDTGAAFGQGIQDSVGALGDNIKNSISGFTDTLSPESIMSNGLIGGVMGTDGAPDPNDPSYALDPYDMDKKLDDIKNNTGDIADNMELSNDELDYLRKIAEMEWRKEFTTAEIKIDMTNNNTVNGERDLDGIVSYLSDVLREEMTSVANGVHA